MAKIIILGPAFPLRGGIATFNHRLAKEFIDSGHTCSIWSFSLQYPSILFPGKTQFSDGPPPEGVEVKPIINSVNPLNWWITGRKLKNEKPDVVVVRYWLPFMGPALGTILRLVRKNKHTSIICIADNIIPHESRPGDMAFTRYFIKACDGFITMSDKVMKDLRYFDLHKPAKLVQHPLYDVFGEIVSREEARHFLGIDQTEKIVLFFGFIRKYKGLDLLLRSIALLRNKTPDLKLLVAGEFYEDEKNYHDLIKTLGISDMLIMKTNFISDKEVKYYICAADLLVQPYKNATQSGVTPLAYNFEKPMVVTNVGGLPDFVEHEKSGLIAEPNPESIALNIERYFELGEAHFQPHIREGKKQFSWQNIVNAVLQLAREGRTA